MTAPIRTAPRLLAMTAAALLALTSTAMAQRAPDLSAWPNTDFENTTVDLSEIISGGVGRDGIPAIDDPAFIPVAEEDAIGAMEPVMTYAPETGPARAYPLRYLTWHEIVNDTVGGIPVAITFCPLCNSALAFDRRVEGETLTFGVSGNLRHSDMVMFDRQTDSWWQQATAAGIVGDYAGTQLDQIPVWMESWASFRTAHPDGLVMDQPDAPRDYGRNPYVGYDRAERPFLYRGDPPPHGIPSLARVVRVGDRAWPLERLAERGTVTEEGVTISWEAGKASALDMPVIAEGRDVGQIRVRDADGRDVVHDVLFAFAFDAFWPEGEWMLGN